MKPSTKLPCEDTKQHSNQQFSHIELRTTKSQQLTSAYKYSEGT